MSELRTVAQQALEALSLALSDVDWRANSPTQPVIHKAHTALRAALAEPQEPVAYIHRQGNYWDTSERHLTDDEKARGWTEEPLFTAPPQRPAEPVQEPPCATRECMPSECPNCVSLQDQNTELDRKLADVEQTSQEQPICDECGKSKHDGWALYCVGCMEPLFAPQRPAEPVQEPVAWMVYTLDGKSVCVTDNPADFTDEHRVLPLYTAPPQRKPLTEEEIAKCWHNTPWCGPMLPLTNDNTSSIFWRECMSAVLEHTTTTSTQPTASATCLPLNLRRRATDIYYNPTQGAIDAGVAKRKSFPLNKFAEACSYANECNERIDEWRTETSHIAGLQKDGKVKDIVFAYLHSIDFTRLADITKTQYKSSIEAWRNVRVAGMALQHHKLSNLETPMIQRMYDEQVRQTSPYAANYNMTVYRIVLNYAIRCGYTRHNPFEKVRKKATKHRKVMWERDNVRAFLNVAFSRWQWRNIGIVFYMIYEWGQRVSDILNLKWENINFDTNTVTITQSKRGATVKLPISQGLATMLKQQQKDFFLSPYVAPQMVRRQGKWTPYSIATLNNHVIDIMAEARLNKELQLRDLRRTAITETIENGGDLLTVMQMSGHQHTSSVTPYFVHTRRGAAKAQEIRQFPQHLMNQPVLLQRGAR